MKKRNGNGNGECRTGLWVVIVGVWIVTIIGAYCAGDNDGNREGWQECRAVGKIDDVRTAKFQSYFIGAAVRMGFAVGQSCEHKQQHLCLCRDLVGFDFRERYDDAVTHTTYFARGLEGRRVPRWNDLDL